MLNTNLNIKLELEIFPTVTDKHSNFFVLDDGHQLVNCLFLVVSERPL